ncbi:type II toxin-antitoxin system VapC family toxin [Halomarina halobia]|uniref:Type II toxin-antitoxin system VapC family toxin n=1 Tax=Halomarina halobia TaxID=3033386 RepID=A0ABD6AAK0_9EURY|nr:PIN domain-containing protein [Halomarina sp. PSR21]
MNDPASAISDGGRFQPSEVGTQPVEIDSSALYAYFNRNDQCHADVIEFFEAIRHRQTPFRPLYVTDYALDETLTRLSKRVSAEIAAAALETVFESTLLTVEHIETGTFELACDWFGRYTDSGVGSFTDFVIAAHAEGSGASHVLTYDNDFDVFDLTRLPHYRLEA